IEWVEEPAIVETICSLHGPERLSAPIARKDGEEVERRADEYSGGMRPNARDSQAVRQEQVMADIHRGLRVPAYSGRVLARDIAEIRAAPRLVLRDPPAHAIAQTLSHHLGILGEGLGGVAVAPAAVPVEREGQIPMVQRRDGRDAPREQVVYEAAI